jgi:hypothetical protein
VSRANPAPCGTEAAARRHQRRHEPLDEACRAAANRASAMRQATRDGRQYDPYAETTPPPAAAPRNGLPILPYHWHQARYPWAERTLAAAEAIHGQPGPGNDTGWEAA